MFMKLRRMTKTLVDHELNSQGSAIKWGLDLRVSTKQVWGSNTKDIDVDYVQVGLGEGRGSEKNGLSSSFRGCCGYRGSCRRGPDGSYGQQAWQRYPHRMLSGGGELLRVTATDRVVCWRHRSTREAA
jgi:hypothetical protein